MWQRIGIVVCAIFMLVGCGGGGSDSGGGSRHDGFYVGVESGVSNGQSYSGRVTLNVGGGRVTIRYTTATWVGEVRGSSFKTDPVEFTDCPSAVSYYTGTFDNNRVVGTYYLQGCGTSVRGSYSASRQ